MPPHTYLTHLRIARAKELLHRGVRASDVAPQVGFYDQAQLTRHFRRLVGTTPARYGKSPRDHKNKSGTEPFAAAVSAASLARRRAYAVVHGISITSRQRSARIENPTSAASERGSAETTRGDQVSGIRTVASGANALRTQSLHQPQESVTDTPSASDQNRTLSTRWETMTWSAAIGWVTGIRTHRPSAGPPNCVRNDTATG